MDPRIEREADDFASDAAEFAEYIRTERGNEAAREFLDRIMARLNEIQPAARQTAGEWFSQ